MLVVLCLNAWLSVLCCENFSGSRLGGHVAAQLGPSTPRRKPAFFFLPSKLPLSSFLEATPHSHTLRGAVSCQSAHWDSELLRLPGTSQRALCVCMWNKNSRPLQGALLQWRKVIFDPPFLSPPSFWRFFCTPESPPPSPVFGVEFFFQ